MRKMSSARPTVAALVLGLGVLAAPLAGQIARAEDTLVLSWPDGWELGRDGEDPSRGYAVTQFVPVGQTVEEWTDLLTVEDFAVGSAPATTPFLMMHRLKTYMQGRCGTSIFWKVLEHRNNTILYEWTTSNCRKNEPDQHAIVRILYGQSDVWIVTYRGRVKPLGQLAPETRDWWIGWLGGIHIVVK